MKTSLRKLRGIAGHHRADPKEKKGGGHPRLQFDELARASQDMRDMKNCYDGLLSAAAATANCAYEFSESLGELGANLLKRTALNDDEDSGRVLLMLGKVHFELQKLVDIYRSHITLTISTPSESLLNELRTVEEMKRQCDGKRVAYEQMLKSSRERGRSKNSTGGFSQQQLQEAREEFDEEATLFVFRLKSLKQGQSRSLLTQAVRHHSAQLNFFRKGTKLLEAIEPHVKMEAEKQHIDYQFAGLGDYDDDDDDDEDDDDDDDDDDGEVDVDDDDDDDDGVDDDASEPADVPPVKNSDEVKTAISFVDLPQEENIHFGRLPHPVSNSAPIFPAEGGVVNLRRMSTRKVNAYVLPTPLDCKLSSAPLAPLDGNSTWPGKLGQLTPGHQQSPPAKNPPTPPPLREAHQSQTLTLISEAKKLRRQAFSGPLLSQRPAVTSSALLFPPAAPPSHLPRPPPKISELHELPRPPERANNSRHSAPLPCRARELSISGKNHGGAATQLAAPLPEPQGAAMARSFSIPSRSQRGSLDAVKLMEAPPRGVSSPPLTPISHLPSQSRHEHWANKY